MVSDLYSAFTNFAELHIYSIGFSYGHFGGESVRNSLITPQQNLTHAKNDKSGVGRFPMESNQILYESAPLPGSLMRCL